MYMPQQHCVESALVALVHEFQLTLAPSMLALLQKVQTIDSSADTNSLRIKEAGQSIFILDEVDLSLSSFSFQCRGFVCI